MSRSGTSYRSWQPEHEYDAIVIGSGIGGLGVAALLANRAGKRVLVKPGVVLDYDAAGNLTGIDIDNASVKVDLKKLILSRLPGEVESDSA